MLNTIKLAICLKLIYFSNVLLFLLLVVCKILFTKYMTT